MSEAIALSFPVLDEDGASFTGGVSYKVAATIQGAVPPRTLTVEHCLTGSSFVRDWVRSGDARFSTRLLFRNSARREVWPFEDALDMSGDALVAKQQIPVRFFDTPEVTCSIVAAKDRQLVVSHPESGLTDFWREGERIDIPCYARIGRHSMLSFDDGSFASLIHVVEDKELDYGQMKAEVNEYAREREKPVTLYCAKDVYDELHALKEARPSTSREAMQSAILTQALCAIYGYMKSYTEMKTHDEHYDYDEDEINPTLRSHGISLKEKTGTIWGEEDFNPSLAATQMRPYVIVKTDDADDED